MGNARRTVGERLVNFRARTILKVLALAIAFVLLLYILWIGKRVVTWILIALFLALALNPAVEWLQSKGVRRRGIATGVTYLAALAAIAGIGALFVPTLVSEVGDFADAVPGYIEDVT